MKAVIRKNISDRMLKTMKNQMLLERGEGCRCKGKTPKTFFKLSNSEKKNISETVIRKKENISENSDKEKSK